MSKREDIADDLRSIAAFDYVIERGERIDNARAANPPFTWREIAQLLGMTENGVHKAYAAYQAKITSF